MKPYCCEGIGLGNENVYNPVFGSTCGKNTPVWTMKEGNTDFTMCTNKCTAFYCEAKNCTQSFNCYLNRYHTCDSVPQEWKTQNCKSSSSTSSYKTAKCQKIAVIFIMTVLLMMKSIYI